ncbi:hypothetical protein LCGC14_1725890 [marine sediment metagenome]|uniref:Uncharacterized protein n=1 Tax=marine sediment metagenome TaxID=412755 RepID=A0A0F9HAU6_9ZZZZ
MKFKSEEPEGWEFICAASAMDQGNYEDETHLTFNPETERKVIFKDLQSRLSFEAREVIRIILHSPMEIIQIMTPKSRDITKRSVTEFIQCHFFNVRVQNLKVLDKRTVKIMDELEEFVESF